MLLNQKQWSKFLKTGIITLSFFPFVVFSLPLCSAETPAKQSGQESGTSTATDDEVARLMEILNRYETKFAEKSKEAQENRELIQAQREEETPDDESAEIDMIMAKLDHEGGTADEEPAVLDKNVQADSEIYVLDAEGRKKAEEENAIYRYDPSADASSDLKKAAPVKLKRQEPLKETVEKAAPLAVIPQPPSARNAPAASSAYVPQKNIQQAPQNYRPATESIQTPPRPADSQPDEMVKEDTAMPAVVSAGQVPRPVVKTQAPAQTADSIASQGQQKEIISKPEVAAVKPAEPVVSEAVSAPAMTATPQNSGEAEIVIFDDEGYENRHGRAVRRTATVSPRRSFQSAAEEMAQQPTVVVGDINKPIIVEEAVEVEGGQPASRRRRVAKSFKKPEPPKPNLYAQSFFMSPEQRLSQETYDMNGLVVMKTPGAVNEEAYSVVTDFAGGTLRSRSLSGFENLEQINDWMEKEIKTADFEGVEIKQLTVGQDTANAKTLYWVGHRSFSSADEARLQIAMVKDLVEANGEDFGKLVSDAARYIPAPEKKAPVEIKTPAQFAQEEKIMLKYLDQMDIGEELFGPFQGEGTGEPLVWQSFGETTWRQTNLDKKNFSSQVGFWTNRLVFKGVRFPLSTLDPFVESTMAIEAHGADFASNVKFFAGVEWRPFARNPWLFNFRPWSGINIAEWIRNYRFYVMYGDRKNLKDPIDGSDDHDLIAGVQIFYEWGVELPPLTAPEPETTGEYIERIIWGEYFGNYRFEMTNFSSEDDYDGWILNSSIILGVKLPGIPLPENPINNEIVLMPYMKFEHVNSTAFSFPYQNQYFIAAGIRWMPFRNYRFKENEWLSKTKIFGEYVGVGLAQHAKQDGEAPDAVRWDLRFGVSFSQRRF